MLQIVNSRYNIAESQTIGHLLPLPDDTIGLSWDDAKPHRRTALCSARPHWQRKLSTCSC
ncbi:MAG: hypothetical protein R3C26_19355 [Calditrichia bacterium]